MGKKHHRGLSEAEVRESRMRHGANLLTPPPHRSAWSILADKLKEPLILILSLAALLSVLTDGWVEGGGILLAILLSAGIGFFSEYRAGRAFDILNRTEDETPVRVLRGGRIVTRPKSELVAGDVFLLETGEEVPADARVLEASEFNLDQSKFTGEPELVLKVPADHPEFPVLAQSATYAPDLVLRGSTVLSGNATLEILAVGMSTEIGKTAQSATEITDETTPLQKQLRHLSKVIAIFGFAAAVVLFALLLGRAWANDSLNLSVILGFFMLAVTLIVVTVPEGLPMSVTLSLACSMRKMAQSNCLIRKLHACETIGCATVICTDKTGTLTMNQMRLAEAVFPENSAALVAEAIATNSTGNLDGDEVLGNPTEGALLIYLRQQKIDYNQLREENPPLQRWNFTTETKYMATALASGTIHIKGAPEIILEKCAFRQCADGDFPLSDAERVRIREDLAKEQAKGRRTLAFAFTRTPGESPSDSRNFIFLGYAAISDPVRPEVPAAIEACRKAGIQVKIVTGDTGATASEIAREIGLDAQTVVEGRAFGALSSEETTPVAKKLSVIARARPDDKLKLVNALQQSGEVVAVTGDGTNDAPALHHADVGIAMGKTGTAIAREASDIILLDDSFGSIVNAVLWGRSLYLNIQRFLVFQLTINLAAAGIALAGPFLGVEMPFTVIQMLWINLIMDTFAALALATEPPTPAVMKQHPRKPGSFIVTGAMAKQIAGTSVLFMGMFFATALYWRQNGLDARELTILFTAFVLLQVWNLLNVRTIGSDKSMLHRPKCENWVFPGIVGGIVLAQVAITQWGGKIFRTVPLKFSDWITLIAVTSLVFWIGELLRMQRRRNNRSTSCRR
ncbi:MAG: calcium-translocating P-type ATPase, PMCA-type [Victivallaceae bacterium]|nr:calcium-translocating P-type ATPase, PMCA-type [Victivallaceae bacterium]